MGFVEEYIFHVATRIDRLEQILKYTKHSQKRRKIQDEIKRHKEFLELHFEEKAKERHELAVSLFGEERAKTIGTIADVVLEVVDEIIKEQVFGEEEGGTLD